MSEQRKSDWQHPNSYYRKREETEHAAADESDTSRHPQPFRTIPTKAVQVMADPGRDVILEALHFLVEIWSPAAVLLHGRYFGAGPPRSLMDIVCHLHAPSIGANCSAPPMVASGPKRLLAASQR